jgi:DHA1 family multidrug resistance protein-like MFS transporter
MAGNARTATAASVATPSAISWRRNLAFIWIGVFVGLLGANFVFPFIPLYIKQLGVTDKADVAYFTGISSSATGLSLALTAPIWGSLADRYGRKPMFIRALVGAGVLIGLMGIASNIWQLVFLRFLMGAFAGTMGAAAALVAATTPREKAASALGTLQTGQFLANMLGPVVGGIVAASLGIRESFIFCAALYGIAAFLGYIFVKEAPVGSIEPDEAGDGPRKPSGLISDMRIVTAERQVLLMLLFMFMLWLSTTFVRPVMPISIEDFGTAVAGSEEVDVKLFGFVLDEPTATGILFGVIGLTSTIAALSVAPLGRRFGFRNCVAGAALLTGLLYLPVALAGDFLSFTLLLGAVGLFQGAMVPGTNALLAVSVPEGKQGSAFGLAASMQSLALLIGPLGGGFVSGLAGNPAVYFTIGVMLMLTAIPAYLFIREPDMFTVRERPAPVSSH